MPRSAASPWRRLGFAVIVLSLLVGICLPFFVDLVARDAPEVRAGVVDYSRWGPLTKPVQRKAAYSSSSGRPLGSP